MKSNLSKYHLHQKSSSTVLLLTLFSSYGYQTVFLPTKSRRYSHCQTIFSSTNDRQPYENHFSSSHSHTLSSTHHRLPTTRRLSSTATTTKSNTTTNSTEISNITSSVSWNQAVSNAEALVHKKGGSVLKHSDILGKDLSLITENIKRLLGTKHPALQTVSNYYFKQKGKHIRPLIVLLISSATSITAKTEAVVQKNINHPLTPSVSDVVFSDVDSTLIPRNVSKNNNRLQKDSKYYQISQQEDNTKKSQKTNHILPTQQRLAEIIEMIHTASLLHDDVIDHAAMRRNQPSANEEFGNKMAILAGDFLLSRASVALARLQNVQVVEMIATIIANLVEGEFMQLRNGSSPSSSSSLSSSFLNNNCNYSGGVTGNKMDVGRIVGDYASSIRSSFFQTNDGKLKRSFDYYLEKTYLKTASLIALSCRASAVLSNCQGDVCQAAFAYGKNIGIAFQLIDDMLDFVVTADEFGKPVNADLSLGLATAPVLYAAEKYPELWILIDRKFSKPGDVIKALEIVHKTDGLQKTRELAQEYVYAAIKSIDTLPESQAKTALIELTKSVLNRTK